MSPGGVGRGRTCKRVGMATVVLVLVLASVFNFTNFLLPALATGEPVSATRCAEQAPLTAHGELSEGRHHQWLETTPDFAGAGLRFWSLYLHFVVNARTGMAYDWRLNATDPARQQLRFEVLTRWALLHPGWDRDPWILLYDCPPSPAVINDDGQKPSPSARRS